MEQTPVEHHQQYDALLEVCRNLSVNLDLEPLLNSIIEVASHLTFSEGSVILTFDRGERFMRYMAAPWFMMDSLRQQVIPFDLSMAGEAFELKQAVAACEANLNGNAGRWADWKIIKEMHCMLAVPMLVKGEVIGVLEAYNKKEGIPYSAEDIYILETLAAQAANAIQNHRLIKEAQEACARAMELDRMKNDFIAIASHELRTPLGLILGHASFLNEAVTGDQKEDVDVIMRAAIRLKDVIEGLSNIDDLKKEIEELRRGRIIVQLLAQEVVDELKDLAGQHKVSVGLDAVSSNLVVEGDGEKIHLALENLVKNAIIFNQPGGKVRVRLEQVPGYVKVSVADNGIGIPESEHEKIFRRFYQVEKHLTRRHGGMGVGLAVSKEIVEKHGGRIWVESMEGKGSRFIFLLPHNAAQASAAARVFLV